MKIQSFFLLVLSLTVLNASLFAEENVYSKGDLLGSAGVSVYHFGAIVAGDYGLHDLFSAGIAAGYNGYSFVPQVRTHQVPLVARLAFHPFNLSAIADKIVVRTMIDVYAGICGGWVFRWQTSERGILLDEQEKGSFAIREYIGMRYYFKENIALFVEDNGPLSYIGGGITYKF
ncbi:MAG: hypothetical protein JW863_08035 [Chitinispirillaceae bacterium]|nr:hypothetical protein [Chitinispirillaceae bacterium]